MYSSYHSPYHHYPLHTDAGVLIQQWQATLRSRPPPNIEKRSLSELLSLLKSADGHVTRLEELHQEISVSTSSSSASLWTEVSQEKQSLEMTLQIFTPQTKSYLRKRLTRYKRKRLKRKSEEEKRQRETAIKSKRADEWFDEKCKKELRARLEKTVETSATASLVAVKKKQDDITSHSNLLETLKELREHRRSKRDKGELPPIDEDKAFEEQCARLESILSKYTELYKKEERALHVMISETVDSALTKQLAGKAVQEKEKKTLSTDEFYNTTDIDIIEQRQMEWNKYLSVRGTPLPHIEAPPPSNKTWACYLKKEA